MKTIDVNGAQMLPVEFPIGSKVHIDGFTDLVATVIAIEWRGRSIAYQVGWFNDGQSHDDWFADFRLSEARRA